MKEKLLVILGPTATGKTELALNLAHKFQGELVSADSRQVYSGLDIGTGKWPNGQWIMDNGQLKKKNGFWEIDGVKVWMYDVVDPKVQYSVASYVKDAKKIIKNILNKNKLPIIVGGSGLYLKAILEGLPNLRVPVDKNLRKELEKLSLEKLQKKLQEVSFKVWKKMNYSDQQNPRRLVRQIELSFTSDGGPLALSEAEGKGLLLKIGLTASRDILYQRVDKRVLTRIDQGMVEEAKRLYRAGLSLQRMKSLGLEYGVLADYLSKKIKSMDELIKIMQGKIHRFVRSQLTWFKKEKNINWFNISDLNYIEKVENKVRKWYY